MEKRNEYWYLAFRLGVGITYIPIKVVDCVIHFIVGIFAGVYVGVKETIEELFKIKHYM